MKKTQFIISLFLIACLSINAQEKKIKFNKGTLKICSSKNFTISGYDGNEVIIKSLHGKRSINLSGNVAYIKGSNKSSNKRKVNSQVKGIQYYPKKNSKNKGNYIFGSGTKNLDSTNTNQVFFISSDGNRKKGLKKLGKNNEDKELGIYFTIEQKGNELIFKDNTEGQFIMSSNEKYEIKIPNSIKLNWTTDTCSKTKEQNNQFAFYSSKASSLSNFNGEVEISTSLNNMKLTDVTGPVSINTIGGNVTVEFDKKTPKKLYSIYTNNGFIDITLPSNSDVSIDADASSIFSDIDFDVQEESTKNDLQQMKLKLKRGNVKMKLNAGLGNVYLRKG